MSRKYNGVSVVLAGAAGQGIQTIESILTNVLHREGFAVGASKEYMSRIRGGSNSTEVRVGTISRTGYVRAIDVCFPLDTAALRHLADRIGPETILMGDEARLREKLPNHKIIDVPLGRIASELGNPVFANTVAAGVVVGLLGAKVKGLRSYISDQFRSKGEEVVAKNLEAAEQGFHLGKHVAYMEHAEFRLVERRGETTHWLVSGNDALGAGFLRGGVNFLASYPMSPGTGILTYFATRAEKYRLAVEQAEDEIAAINMGLGASYAGARALVTTSGGGFALMEEGVSLSAMLETPIVIHIAMRPGPATGLPTRTEQGDFNLALYSGHGEFPRAIYAPGDTAEGYEIGQESVRIADKYQSPIFVLSDQYFLDCVESVDQKTLRDIEWQPSIIETTADYERYRYTDDGISPRGVPGYGAGLVVVDSDEHTEDGHLTEDIETRVRMTNKRLKKHEGLQAEVLLPIVSGVDSAPIIIVGWGSTKSVIAEALEISKREDMKHIHFKQVWPLPKDIKKYFKGAKKVLVVENNAAGQFATQLKLAGVKITENVLKYDGEPFSVEELIERFLKA